MSFTQQSQTQIGMTKISASFDEFLILCILSYQEESISPSGEIDR